MFFSSKKLTIQGIYSKLVKQGEKLSDSLDKALNANNISISQGDIITIASKVLFEDPSTLIPISSLDISEDALELSFLTGLDSVFVQAILNESTGKIYSIGSGFILCDSYYGVCVNAGLDASNAPPGYFVALPKNIESLLSTLYTKYDKNAGFIVTDSRSQPSRRGVIGVALASIGVEGISDERGLPDLYGHQMTQKIRSTADQLASISQFIMGETTELTPFTHIRGTDCQGDFPFIHYNHNLSHQDDMYLGQIVKAHSEYSKIISRIRGDNHSHT